ncbi:MAG: transcription antitermination factor NusB [Oscillospiraceae bacterium]|nr:transcription antitermination factor NusB [Oscillospiraceae bacterium]
MTRTAAREIAIQLGFSVAATGQQPEEALFAFFEPEHYAAMAEEGDIYREGPSAKDMSFIRRSVTGVAERREELDGYIGRYAKGWRTERISRSAAAVLRQAMYEVLYMPDVPDASAINEAVDLAKGYEDREVVAFINGVLGGFYQGEVAASKPQETTPPPEETAGQPQETEPEAAPSEPNEMLPEDAPPEGESADERDE